MSSRVHAPWSQAPSELLDDIFSRLDVAGFVRARAVCRPWRDVRSGTQPHTPWLVPSTSVPCRNQGQPTLLDFYALHSLHGDGEGGDQDNTYKKLTLGLGFPQVANRQIIGSTQGFIVSVDSLSSTAINATNPLTKVSFPFPAATPDILPLVDEMFQDPELSATLISQNVTLKFIKDDIRKYKVGYTYNRVVISPSLNMAAALVDTLFSTTPKADLPVRRLLFSPAGDNSWTDLDTLLHQSSDLPFLVGWMDILFHQGRLYAITLNGELVVFDVNHPTSSPLVFRDACHVKSPIFLVESPDGNDLFLLPANNICVEELRVFKLDKSSHQFEQTHDLGEVAIFLSEMTAASSVSTFSLPILQRNCVYFASQDGENHLGVYSLEHESIEDLAYSDVATEMHVGVRHEWVPIWFSPYINREAEPQED